MNVLFYIQIFIDKHILSTVKGPDKKTLNIKTANTGVLWKMVFLDISQNSQVFSCEFCEISKNTFFTEHHWMTASDIY